MNTRKGLGIVAALVMMAALTAALVLVLVTCDNPAGDKPTGGETQQDDNGDNGGDNGGGGATTTYKSIAAVRAYLAAAGGGTTVNNPVSLPVELNLANDWTGLLNAIADVGKYVALDLSACATPGEFDADARTANNGKYRIVSLVLPVAATSIKAGSYDYPTFKDFGYLKSVGGSNIIIVNTYAFRFCSTLTTVSFPNALSIGEFAFGGSGLTTVYLPKAASIGRYAFGYCTALTTVSLPEATSIGNLAFSDCNALATVNLGSKAPTLGIVIFSENTSGQTVTVKVPSGASGYGSIPATYSGSNSTETWGNGFRGNGWTGSAFTYSGVVNNYITVEIKYQ